MIQHPSNRSTTRVRLIPLLALAIVAGMPSGAGRVTAQPASIADALRLRVEQLHDAPHMSILGARLLQPDAVAHFFVDRGFEPAWSTPEAVDQILAAIEKIERDGLTPADYHLRAIEAAKAARLTNPAPQLEADLQLLLTDAVAALIDHVYYGKVRAVTLDPRWNVDPRFAAPPLETLLPRIATAASIGAAIDAAKPNHFIYEGLTKALATLRSIAAAGGWPAVPAGASIAPGKSHPRVAAVRRRLAVTGELPPGASTDSELYDEELRKAVVSFQQHHRLGGDGTIGKATVEALNVTAETRIMQLRVNLERARWVVGGLSDSFILVNLPAFKAYVIRGGKNVWETRTQIGRAARQTPAFRGDMRYIVFNPDWTVPPTILAQDVLGGMRKGQNTIKKKGLTIIDRRGRVVDPDSIDWQSATPGRFPYTLRQPPGASNALGRVKFMFPNEHAIFLHDTPSRELFTADQRTFSSGCIRVENPLDLAAVLLEPQGGWTRERIQKVVDAGKSETVLLHESLPVLIVYWTVSVGASGDLRYARDVYNLDAALQRALDAAPKPAQQNRASE